MKTFVVTSKGVTAGLPVGLDPYPHVPVGEAGRGRHLERVALGQRDFPTRTVRIVTGYRDSAAQCGPMTVWAGVPDPPTPPGGVEGWSAYNAQLQRWKEAHQLGGLHQIHDLAPVRTREKGTLLLVRAERTDRRALVLLAVPAGYRGGTTIRMGTAMASPCQYQGSNDGWTPGTRCPLCGTRVTMSEPFPGAGYSRATHPEEGMSPWQHLSEGHDADGVTVLAEGSVAQGDAGRMGGHRVVLAIMEPGSRIRVSRQGRLYGDAPAVVVRWDGAELRAGPPDEVDPPGDDEATEDAIPL